MRIQSLPIILVLGSLALSDYFVDVVNGRQYARGLANDDDDWETYYPTQYPTHFPTSSSDDDGHWEEDAHTTTATTMPPPPKTDPPPPPPPSTTESPTAESWEGDVHEESPLEEEEQMAGANPATQRTSAIVGSFPNGVPGSGYGCSNTCGGPQDDADVYYTIRASIETYEVPNSENITGFPADRPAGPVSMLTRTFTGVPEESSPFCDNGYDGTTGPLGPCLKFLPGQRVKIRIINDIKDGMTILKQHKAELDEYWALVAEPGQPGLDDIDWFGPLPASPADMYITNEQDLPGWDVTYDDVNLHFHGMQVVPHMFYPQGTGDAKADWITITPEATNPDQQCFCYVLEIPEDHPQGTFWWHIHRHGSTSMQAWQGMVGLLKVGDESSAGSPESDLIPQGVVREETIALWEWVVMPNRRVNNNTSTFYEGNFIEIDDGPSPITTYLTGNAYQPTYGMTVGETVHWRLLCAQTGTGSGIYIIDEDGNEVAFYVFASDGISYSQAVKQQAIVIGPGQREALLLQFQKAGTYKVMQLIINDFQGTGESENQNEPLAYIEVTDGIASSGVNNIDISKLVFTPGMKSGIDTEEVVNQVSINFEVQSMKDRAPVAQFIINGKEFDVARIDEKEFAATSTSWTLTSNMNYFHPFHIHVNPFQVMDIQTGYLPGKLVGNTSLQEAVFATSMNPTPQWRDTTFIPPWGSTVIRQRFGESISWTGKTVFHCHFLDHEDQGMISAMMILDPSDHSWGDDGWEGDGDAGIDPETQISSFAKTEISSDGWEEDGNAGIDPEKQILSSRDHSSGDDGWEGDGNAGVHPKARIPSSSDHSSGDSGWEGDGNAGVDPETQISSFAKTENSSQRRTANFVSFAVLTLIIGMVV